MQNISRRAILATPAAALAAQTPVPAFDAALLKRHDEAVDALLRRQVMAPQRRHHGAIPDEYGIVFPHSPAGLLSAGVAAWMTPGSRHHRSGELMGRLRVAAGWLVRNQLPSGNFDLPTTNFNSPPDTGFVVHSLGGAAVLARQGGAKEISGAIEPVLRRVGAALVAGGVHTPNHRWVVCEALAQLHELFGEAAYVKRIDQWLAEGVDIDGDGQYNERSTTIYNAVTDRALLVMALKLKRPELLTPVRRNLEAMLWLQHADGEVVTEISSRQDANERGDMRRYWFPLRMMALRDGDGRFATLAERYEAEQASLPLYLEYPELRAALPARAALPEDYRRRFEALGITRIRRGEVSATVIGNGNSRVFTLRNGGCVINAVRFATAFFGKGQFIPDSFADEGMTMRQSMEGPYYQPFTPARAVGAREWGSTRGGRARSEVCAMEYEVRVREQGRVFEVEMSAAGTNDVPLAIEVSVREDAEIHGVAPAPNAPEAFLLERGEAVVRQGGRAIRFGPGVGDHRWVRLRGALPQLPGQSVYLCGVTPFRRVLRFECL
ncbi:MAG: hypothetical protein KJZ79_21720 [Bryobacteraceae bacterium]|nr:hypothetical protein [Bryobacteraceae bacterium]